MLDLNLPGPLLTPYYISLPFPCHTTGSNFDNRRPPVDQPSQQFAGHAVL
jgi:hypothetical protein